MKSKFTNQSSVFTVLENPLGELKPDEWKNIPICLVNAFKLMINTNEHNYQNIRTLESKFEIIRNANQTNITRVDREIKRRDEEIRVGMKEMGTDIVKKFEGEVKELNELMKNQLKNMNTQILDFSKSIFEQEKKVVRVLRELPIKD